MRRTRRNRITVWLLMAAMALLLLPAQTLQAKVKLNASSRTLTVGEKLTLKVKGTKKKVKVTWKSSKKSVATVSKKGVVKAKKAGSAKITAKIKGKGIKVTRTCKINVVKKSGSSAAATAAKKLSDYIVKKGSREEDGLYHLTTIDFPEEESSQTAEIYVKKGTTKLFFIYHYNSDTPQYHQNLRMVMDPAKAASGALTYTADQDSYSDDIVSILGEMTAEFDGEEAGITWKEPDFQFANSDGEEESSVSEEAKASQTEKASGYTKRAMADWAKLLEKAGVSWAELGLGAYTPQD